MRRLWLVFVLICVIPLQAVSYVASDNIVVTNTAIGFTAAKLSDSGFQATVAVCRLEGAEIRYQVDGTTPTTTVGMPFEPLETQTFTGNDLLRKFQAIRTGAASGTLNCTYTAP